MSAPPATTGVPSVSPVSPAARRVTVPMTVPGSRTGGSIDESMPLIRAIWGDQVRSASENIPELEPHEGSVASTPDSLVAIQSLSMPMPRADSRTSGRCPASQRSLAGVVMETQSPPIE